MQFFIPQPQSLRGAVALRVLASCTAGAEMGALEGNRSRLWGLALYLRQVEVL